MGHGGGDIEGATPCVEGYCFGKECFCSEEKEMVTVGKKVNSDEEPKQVEKRLGL